jgi:pimeloyl-ACP methyl ester carboxylesterase
MLGTHCPVVVKQSRVVRPGFVEPHTPGSGASVELPTTPTVDAIVGAGADLNRTLTVRTRVPGRRPEAVLILMPGFLGGASTFDPLARDLVRASRGRIQVWAIDRRSNQLEDRRGAELARFKAEIGDRFGDDELVTAGLEDGVRFYFDVDLDGDTVPDPPTELPDASGASSSFLRLEQDDLRFAAHWGVDTVVRDWKTLVDEARDLVGPDGVVVVGGHSLGTTWAGLYAAYDFDPTAGVDAAHDGIDGVLLLEGGGPRAPSPSAPDLATYEATVADLESDGGADVFLSSLFELIDPVNLGAAGEMNGLAGSFQPDAPSILQETTLFGGFPINLLLNAPFTNEALVGFFLDDDFSVNPAFSASFGFSDNAPNALNPFFAFFPGDFLVADTSLGLDLRTWKAFDDPTLPTCPPNDPAPVAGSGDVGCALRNNGPKPAPGDPPAIWGEEREVTDLRVLLKTLYETGNASEWYFVSGRPDLDFAFGRDSSALGAEDLLAVTQNANMDAPILAIGGSNGLAPTEDSFASYLGSVATPAADQTITILEGYSHLDVLSATDNEAVEPIVDWVEELLED